MEYEDNLEYSLVNASSYLRAIEASLVKFEVKIHFLRNELAQIKASSNIPTVTSKDLAKTFPTVKLIDSNWQVLDLKAKDCSYYKTLREVARTLSCHHSVIQYCLNKSKTKVYKDRYIITKINQ